MKSTIIVASLLIAGATGSLMSMEKRGCVNLFLNRACVIKSCSAQGKAIPSNEILMKNIFEILPLTRDEESSLINGFDDAFQGNKKVKVPYLQKNRIFIATITPLFAENREHEFFVKLQRIKPGTEIF
jgi:hypothetical protein